MKKSFRPILVLLPLIILFFLACSISNEFFNSLLPTDTPLPTQSTPISGTPVIQIVTVIVEKTIVVTPDEKNLVTAPAEATQKPTEGEPKDKSQSTPISPTKSPTPIPSFTPAPTIIPSPASSFDNFKLVGQIGGSTLTIVIDKNLAYIGEGPRVVVLDISNPSSPQKISQSEVLPGIVQGIDIEGDRLYVVTRYSGLFIFDKQDPFHLKRLNTENPKGLSCNNVSVRDNLAYLACNPNGLIILDVSDPTIPRELSKGEIKSSFVSSALIGNTMYLSDINLPGIRVVDVSDSENPRDIGKFLATQIPGEEGKSGYFESIRACGIYLCAAARQPGLVVIDISSPSSPVFLGRYNLQTSTGLAVLGNLVYIADDMDGVHIIDISNPSNPVQTGWLPTSIGGWEFTVQEIVERGMVVSQNTLFVTDPAYGLTVVNITNPASPERIGAYMPAAPDALSRVIVRGDYIHNG